MKRAINTLPLRGVLTRAFRVREGCNRKVIEL